MAQTDLAQALAEFADIVRPREPLAAYTFLKLGGPADALVQPRSIDELTAVVRRAGERNLPLRVLGSGCSVLVRDEGIRAVVLRLQQPAFQEINVQGTRIRAGAGAALSALISQAARHGLAGLETLVGTPGTVGGALRRNAGDRAGEIGEFVRVVDVVDATGKVKSREREDVRFGYGESNLDEPVLVAGEFELEPDSASAIVKRMRKAWIQRKARQPFSFEAAARVFRNPRGLNAASLIEQAGLVGTRVGGVEVSDRHPSCIVVDPGSAARDVLRLIDLIKSRVQEQFRVELELELSIW